MARTDPRHDRLVARRVARDDFEYPPFVERGGLGKAYELFGDDLDPLLDELTEVLAA